MLDFQSGQRPRSYLDRRQQWRLLAMVMLLGMVVMAALKARNADDYAWFFSLGGADSAPTADYPGESPVAVDTAVHSVPRSQMSPGKFISPGAAIVSEEASSRYFRGVRASHLATVGDGLRRGSGETDAQLHLLELLAKADPVAIRAASTGRVTFIQLFRQSSEYRGELVTIRGTVVRVHWLDVPQNDQGIDGYYRAWIRPADNRHYPIVTHVLRLPDRFPTGRDVSAEVEITGFFFKRWAYQAQDTLRSAPMILARSVEWQEPPAPVLEEGIGLTSILAATGGCALFAVLAAWLAYRRTARSGPSRRELPPTLRIVPVLALFFPLLHLNAFAAQPPTLVASDPRSQFELMGIGPRQFDRFIDGRPWHADEEDVVLKLLYRLGRGSLRMDVRQWSHGTFRSADVRDNPGAYRGEVFQLSGHVVRVGIRKPPAALTDSLKFDRYYRCEFALGQPTERAVVFCRTIPDAWKVGREISQPAGAYAYFLKLEGHDSAPEVPIFVAGRIAWYPPTTLGRLGMDCGLLDDVRMGTPGVEGSDNPLALARNNPEKLRLAAADGECFYQMLDVVGRVPEGELLRLAAEELKSSGKERFPLEPLFNRPGQEQGRLVAFTGTVRRVLRVRVSDDDILARFGIDHFYQLYLFTDASQGNPLVFCVRRLPPGMPTGDGPDFQERVTLAGFFLKTWAYRIDRPKDVAKADVEYQFAPLIIGRQPVWHPTQPERKRPYAGLTGGLAVLLVLLVVWLTLRRIGRGDRKLRGQLKHLGEVDSSNAPDFSGLGRAEE